MQVYTDGQHRWRLTPDQFSISASGVMRIRAHPLAWLKVRRGVVRIFDTEKLRIGFRRVKSREEAHPIQKLRDRHNRIRAYLIYVKPLLAKLGLPTGKSIRGWLAFDEDWESGPVVWAKVGEAFGVYRPGQTSYRKSRVK